MAMVNYRRENVRCYVCQGGLPSCPDRCCGSLKLPANHARELCAGWKFAVSTSAQAEHGRSWEHGAMDIPWSYEIYTKIMNKMIYGAITEMIYGAMPLIKMI